MGELLSAEVQKRRCVACMVSIASRGVVYAANLSPIMPKKLIVGLEIRPQVVELVAKRIEKMRKDGKGKNVSVLLSNFMKSCLNHFSKGQVGAR